MAVGRLAQIVSLVEERGFVSVKELSEACRVSEVTIRRDLEVLDREKRLRRAYGGAYGLLPAQPPTGGEMPAPPLPAGFLTDRADVLVCTPVDPAFDRILLERAAQRHLPLVAESLSVGSPDETLVAVDNYQAGVELGAWAGRYAQAHFGGAAALLDLTFRLSNTRARSQGFWSGLRGTLPAAQMVLSLDGGAGESSAYQLTMDALIVHPEINIIFAINDATALGALQACEERGIDPGGLLVLAFGLEGETLRRALLAGTYCKAGLAMFPEIVGPVCVEAAIEIFNGRRPPRHLVTPHAVLTTKTLADFYYGPEAGCRLRWDMVLDRLAIPLDITRQDRPAGAVPQRIGFVVPFMKHEWYRTLIACMQEHTGPLGIELETTDAEQMLRDDLALRQRRIAETAAEQVQAGDVLLIDGGPINLCLAEALATRQDITVITNSLSIFETLRRSTGITLIATGGVLGQDGESFIGPTAEMALRELRADKLFLSVTGITLNFGLSHSNLGEVAIKQAMLRAAREVILLADHTRFGHDAVSQVAPAMVAHKLITDNALPASARLELSKLGITVIIAKL